MLTPGYHVEDTYHVRHIQRFELGTPYDAIVEQVGELMSTPALRNDAVLVFDRTGVGGAVADLFSQAYMRGRRVTTGLSNHPHRRIQSERWRRWGLPNYRS